MLLPFSKQSKIDDDQLFTHITFCLQLFKVAVVELDSQLMCANAYLIESQGWALKAPLALVRAWRACMSAFGGKCLDTILIIYTQFLDAATASSRAVCPDWKAAFDKDTVNMPLLNKMMSNRLDSIVAAHTALHKLMAAIGSSATALRVTPRLQDHGATAQHIAIALNCLSNASQSAVICMGRTLIEQGAVDPKMAKCAADFMTKHKGPNPDIPMAFWGELEMVAVGAAASTPSSKIHRHMSDHPVVPIKKEVGDEPRSTAMSSKANIAGTAAVPAKRHFDSISASASTQPSSSASATVAKAKVGLKKIKRSRAARFTVGASALALPEPRIHELIGAMPQSGMVKHACALLGRLSLRPLASDQEHRQRCSIRLEPCGVSGKRGGVSQTVFHLSGRMLLPLSGSNVVCSEPAPHMPT